MAVANRSQGSVRIVAVTKAHPLEAVDAAVMAGLRDRGLVDEAGHLTPAGRDTKARIEELTDVLAEPPYDTLDAADLDRLIDLLEPISARLQAAGSR